MNGRTSRVRLLSATLAAALVAALIQATPARADDPKPEHLKSQVEKLDQDGRAVRPGAARPAASPKSVSYPQPVWPSAGTATVSVRDKRVQAGSLPISVGRGAGVSQVTVSVLDRAALPATWRDGVVARVSVPAGSPTGTVSVGVDYAKFRYAYGSDWASRLRLWRLPECALATPGKAGCSAVPLVSRNDPATSTVTAEAAAGSVVALAAAAAGPSGDFSATSLAPSSTWSTGGSAGGFNWTYPMRAPATPNGPLPKMELSYSSASVDGRSSATNNQPSWIGEGFEYSPGYIERRYQPCAQDESGSPNNPDQTGDLCWRSDNATMSLNGGGGELIYESGKGWHARAEDGSKIEKLTGASNGDNDGESWKVTTNDGTQYFFGTKSAANSAWTVPVYGNHSGEPCHATAFGDSDCVQVWRWNLDYVVDVHGNTMSYYYDKETNYYAAEVTASKKTAYVRGGTLKRVDYGTWDRGGTDVSTTPTATVEFESADRCLSDCGTHDATHWPDVPWDQECKSDATSCDDYTPTFWSTKRLTKVTTKVGGTAVDSWTLTHSFPSPGDGDQAGLWLASIVHTGLVGGTLAQPPVTLDPVAMTNRVLTKTNTTNNWQRLAAVHTETGATIQVVYSLPECTSSNLPESAQNNTRLCYPVIGPDPYSTSGGDITEWWHKYVVRQVVETDVQLADGHQAPTKNTYYTYGGTPAWHYADDDGFTKPKYKTWNQFRGYATVTEQVGDSSKTMVTTTYLRGMHGDKAAPGGGTRSVTVAASLGSETVYDEDQFAGMVREQVVYNGTADRPVSKTVNVPWRSSASASRTINGDLTEARYVNTRATYAATALGDNGSRGWRVTSSSTDFDDTYGVPVRTQDNGDTGKSGDESCTTYAYNRNTTKNLTTLPRRMTSTATTCATTLTSADQVISDAQTYYDGATDPGTAPTRGLVTRVDGLKGWTAAAGTAWQTTGQSTYDAFGRQLTSTDIKGNASTTSYTPATGISTSSTTTNSLGWGTTTVRSPYWGLPTKVTDPNGRVTEVDYDPLGRVVAVWNNGWARAGHETTPSSRYTYYFAAGRNTYPYIKTETLNANGKYTVGYQIYDAFLRPRQTQSQVLATTERVITDTIYDSWGRVELTYGAHAEPGAASGTLYWEPEWSVPSQTRTVYDQAGRATDSIFLSGDGVTNIVEKWRTTSTYEGDRSTVRPPAGGTVTTTLTDAQGRTTELRQYTTASGVTGAYTSTKYTYNAKDQLTKVTDSAGDAWSYAYDVKGRRIESRDPDRGKTTVAYNDYNEMTSTSDDLGKTLLYDYDSLGRKTAVWDAPVAPSTTPTKRAEWIYDTLYSGVTVRGQLAQAIRYEGTNAYTWQARGYTPRYQPTGANYIIPANETGLAGTYVYGYSYSDYNGAPTSISYPSAGGLVDEQVTTVYNDVSGLPQKLTTAWSGVDTYVAGQQYTSYGEPTVSTLKITGGVYAEQNVSYDPYTRRTDTVTVKPETSAGTVSQRKYQYDDAGNIVGIADTPGVGTADRQCFQLDKLGRLTTAWTPAAAVDCQTATPSLSAMGGAAPYWLDWTIDPLGNRTKEVSHAAAGDTVRDYAVPAAGEGVVRPHAVTSMTTTKPGETAGTTVTYGYDAAGNTTSRPGTAGAQTLTWDSEGHLAKATEGSTTVEENVYDADGNRLIRRDATGQTLYLPGMEIRRAVSGSTATLNATRYYSFNGQTIASRTPGTRTLTWLFADHQGTQQIAVNAYTQAVQIRRQTPYGAPRGTPPTWPNNKGFVGGDNDPTGLVHIGAREYDATLGRFISVDPLQDLSDPQQWSAYAYSVNSPITQSDPTGADPCPNGGGGCGYPDTPDYIQHPNQCGSANACERHQELNPNPNKSHSGGGKGGGNSADGGNGNSPGGGLSDEDVRRAQEIKKKNAIDVIIAEGGKILMDFFGINDIISCATKGDIKACAMTLLNFIPWGKVFKAVKAIPMVVRAGKALMRWMDDVKWADDVLAKAQSCMHSFAPRTRVLLANGKTRPIEELKVGDKVLATDPATGRTEAKAVTVTHSNQDTYLTDITVRTVKDGETRKAVLQTTGNHPLWDEVTKSWIGASYLVPGRAALKAADGGRQEVVAVHSYGGSRNMRDLTVADVHTYYVVAGATPVLVHNCDEFMDFVHGTHSEFADNIESMGLSAAEAEAHSRGGSVAQPGRLFTFRVKPGDSDTMSAAAEWGGNRRTSPDQKPSIMIFRMCKCQYENLKAQGHITTRVTDEQSGMVEHIFGEGAMPHLRQIHREDFG